jgi:hypothetical protein
MAKENKEGIPTVAGRMILTEVLACWTLNVCVIDDSSLLVR